MICMKVNVNGTWKRNNAMQQLNLVLFMIQNVNEVTESHWGPILHVRGNTVDGKRKFEKSILEPFLGIDGTRVYGRVSSGYG